MEAVQNCEKLAYEYGNQQIDQPHLLYSLLTLDDSLIMKLITKMGIQGDMFKNEAKQAIEKLTEGSGGGTQVAVTAIIEKLHGITKKVVSIVEQIVLEIFTAVMLKAGTALFLKQIQTGQTTPVLKIPMSAMYFSLVLTFGLILLIQTVILVEKIIDLKNKEAEA